LPIVVNCLDFGVEYLQERKKMSKNVTEKEQKTVKNKLFSHLEVILRISEDKFLKKRAKDLNRLRWGRLLVSAIDSYGKLFQLIEISELEQRIEQLEVCAKGLGLEENKNEKFA